MIEDERFACSNVATAWKNNQNDTLGGSDGEAEVENSSNLIFTIPKPLYTEKSNTAAVVKMKVDEDYKDNFFKSNIKIEENQELTAAQYEVVDPLFTGFIESNFDTRNIKIEETEVHNSSEGTSFIPYPLSTGGTVNTIEYGRASTEEELYTSKQEELFAQPKKHEKSFQCKICLMVFSQSGNLKKHIRTHTGEKPFQCTICLRAFSQSGHIKSHMRTHTGEKPFQCEICLKAYSQNRYLKTHKMTHMG